MSIMKQYISNWDKLTDEEKKKAEAALSKMFKQNNQTQDEMQYDFMNRDGVTTSFSESDTIIGFRGKLVDFSPIQNAIANSAVDIKPLVDAIQDLRFDMKGYMDGPQGTLAKAVGDRTADEIMKLS